MGFALARVVSAVGMVYGSFPLAGDGRLSDQAVRRRIEGAIMGEPMRFAGKVDGWYYALTVGVNVMLAWPLASFFADPAKEGAFISAVVCLLCLVLCDIFITPTLLRNYVEFDGKGNLLIVFGFQKATYPVSKIRRLRETSNPLASLAASFDRIEQLLGDLFADRREARKDA